jgi:hypothetical protein
MTGSFSLPELLVLGSFQRPADSQTVVHELVPQDVPGAFQAKLALVPGKYIRRIVVLSAAPVVV